MSAQASSRFSRFGMVAGMERRTLLVLTTVVVALLASSAPVSAAAPEPVIVVEGPPAPAPDDGTEPYRDDRSGRCPAGDSRISPGGELDLTGLPELTGVPGPVIAVEPAGADFEAVPLGHRAVVADRVAERQEARGREWKPR